MATLGVDVSYYQGNIDWVSLKNSGVKFAILRIGYTGYASSKTKAVDPMFEVYYKNAKAVGIPVGAYYFSRATTVDEGINEASFVLKQLEGKQFEYPIYIDVEDNYYQDKVSKDSLTSAVKAFCKTIEDKKYYVGIYANLYWLNNKLNLNELKQYDKWVAQWSSKNTFKGSYGMWQYSSTGNVGGLTPVDLNYSYKNFPQIMIDYGLNGYKKEEPQEPSKEVPSDTEPVEEPKEDESDNDNNNDDKEDKEVTNKGLIRNLIVQLLKLIKLVIRFLKKIL